jgi:DNA-binding beta-propeller fold protein YncE
VLGLGIWSSSTGGGHMWSTRDRFAPGAVIGMLLLAIGSAAPVVAIAQTTSSHASTISIQRGSIEIGGSPGVPIANPATSTLYVPIQCPTSYCATSSVSHVVDVIGTSHCNPGDVSDCRVVARARVGNTPLAATLDVSTDTIYVENGTGTVSVVDGAHCNALVTSGCGHSLATIAIGGFLVAGAFNPKTRTLYVASLGPVGDIVVINAARCNALTITGCGQPVREIADSLGPDAVDVDTATDTVYAANVGTGNGNTVSVINGAACNGTTGSGCGVAPPTVTVGSDPYWASVDQATNTVYVANYNDGTVSVIDGARCNATMTAGCRKTPPVASTGAGTAYVAADDSLHTVFALNQNDDTLSAIDTRHCRGSTTAGCRKAPPAAQAGSNHNPGYTGFPNAFALLPQDDSAYLVNVGGENRVSVVTLSSCNAITTTACRVPAPRVPNADYLASVDPSTNTIYAGSLTQPDIDVINGATCDAKHHAGCAPIAEIPMADPQANVGSIDSHTHTLYASDPYSDTVSAINIVACNAANSAGCSAHAPTLIVGQYPGSPVLNPATKSLYIPFGASGNEIAVVNAATCSAADSSGCGQTPALITVGVNTLDIAVSAKTDTVYAPSVGNPFASGDTVDVINGATCDGTDHTGCGQIAATVTVGLGPVGVAVNDDTNTVYVANNFNGDSPGTVSVIDAATCNGSTTTGCTSHHPMVAIGRSPLLLAIDAKSDTVYITDFSSAGVSEVDGATCNATITSGCQTPAREQAVGSQPNGIAVNPDTDTVYALNLFGGGSLSIFAGRT